MTPTPVTNQRKHGVGLLKPVSWNKGRRFTSPGPGPIGTSQNDLIFSSEGPIKRLQIEKYLDDNPEFLENYILTKIQFGTLERWQNQMNAGRPLITDNLNSITVNIEQDDVDEVVQPLNLRPEGYYVQQVRAYHSAECTPVLQRSVSATPIRRKSAAVTPHRKLSAATFGDGCQSPILRQEDDGSMTFLNIPPNNFGRTRDLQQQVDSKNYLEAKDCSRLSNVPDVHDNLTSDMNEASLCFKVAKNFTSFSHAISTTIFQIKGIGAKTYFEASVINISNSSTEDSIQEPISLTKEFRNFLKNTVNGRKSIALGFDEVKERFGTLSFIEENFKTLAVLLLFDVDEVIQGVAILSLGENRVENILDNKLLKDLSKLSGVCMKNASEFFVMRQELTRSQGFLELARHVSDNPSSIGFTVLKMLVNFLNLIECERAQILLSSKEEPTKFSKVYDLEDEDLNKPNFEQMQSPYENRFPLNMGTVGMVAATGQTANFPDNSEDSSFEDDHYIRSLLCMPIKDNDGFIIGVVTLVNKKTGIFTGKDEGFVEAFGIFCGIALANASNYEQLRCAEARKQVALDIMSYHATSNVEESEALAERIVSPSFGLNLHNFSFTDSELEDMDTLTASLRMFEHLDLIKIFNLDNQVLCRWLLTVKKNYRPEVVYHNWRHAFNVCQVMFSCLVNSGWWEDLGPVSCLGLLVACLCHDIDHRGTNNNYQLATNSPLSKLYSSSTLERHHLNQTLVILNLDGHRILDSLSPGDYSKIMSVIEHSILATDLALHFSNLKSLKNMAENKEVNWSSNEDINMVTAALMTASDLGAMTKPWDYQQKIAGMVAEEFWYQGDLEKTQLSSPLVPMFDRELRHELPKLQVGFCQNVCLPVYKALGILHPNLKPLEDAVVSNRDKWEQLSKQEDERNL